VVSPDLEVRYSEWQNATLELTFRSGFATDKHVHTKLINTSFTILATKNAANSLQIKYATF
jgi:hypothetical protein